MKLPLFLLFALSPVATASTTIGTLGGTPSYNVTATLTRLQ